MKLGIVTRYVGFNDGQGRVNHELAREALRRGHEVVLFVEGVDAGLAAEEGVRTVLLPPPRWLPSRLLRDQIFALRSWGRLGWTANHCDAVLTNGFVTWARGDVSAAHFVHGSWVRSPYHPWRLHRTARSLYAYVYNRVNATLEKGALGRARRIVAVSERVRDDLAACGLPRDRIVTINNGVDVADFQPGPSVRAQFGLPEAPVIALFAGDLSTGRKNLDTVLRALPLVPELHLAVAGRVAGSTYPAMAHSLGIADRVHFLGFQRDMSGLMRSVDIFAFPSRYDPFPLALLEALASGLPVVTAQCVGGSDLIGTDAGFVIADSDDHEACAAALRTLTCDQARRRSMGDKARRLAERLSWQATASRHVELLEEMAASSGTRAYA